MGDGWPTLLGLGIISERADDDRWPRQPCADDLLDRNAWEADLPSDEGRPETGLAVGRPPFRGELVHPRAADPQDENDLSDGEKIRRDAKVLTTAATSALHHLVTDPGATNSSHEISATPVKVVSTLRCLARSASSNTKAVGSCSLAGN